MMEEPIQTTETTETTQPVQPAVKPCRHEYVKVFQRRLKGLERRMVVMPVFLPVGLKVGDFSHLGEGSYCFCTSCRTRLFPRRTAADKAAARVALAMGKAAAAAEAELAMAENVDALLESLDAEEVAQKTLDIHVDELELESVDVQDITAEGVKLADDDEESCNLAYDGDI
ncbi:hypothetical protein BH10CYA1_BH10CYA1_11660 [soil metagenome]